MKTLYLYRLTRGSLYLPLKLRQNPTLGNFFYRWSQDDVSEKYRATEETKKHCAFVADLKFQAPNSKFQMPGEKNQKTRTKKQDKRVKRRARMRDTSR
ncbi:hypothetical protein DHB64_07710 [Antarcticibacterium sp. W02-3]|nr:hypothetical protein [Antarcticibacterium sp. W02-3]